MLNGWWWNLISLFILSPIAKDLDLFVKKIEIHVLHIKKYQFWTSWPHPHHEVGIHANDRWLKNAHKFNFSWFIFNKEETRHMCFVLNGSNFVYLWDFIKRNVKQRLFLSFWWRKLKGGGCFFDNQTFKNCF